MRILISLVLTVATSALALSAQAQSDRLVSQKRDLAGILGEVHYIRTICNGKSDQYWREYMRDFLELEGDIAENRSLYIKAFNRGYTYQSNQIRYCDRSAAQLEVNLANKGRKLAEAIAQNYLH